MAHVDGWLSYPNHLGAETLVVAVLQAKAPVQCSFQIVHALLLIHWSLHAWMIFARCSACASLVCTRPVLALHQNDRQNLDPKS